jgi:ribonuclease T2
MSPERRLRALTGCVLAALAFLLAAGTAYAQPYGEASRHRAGSFDYYTLVLAWSPTFCGSLAPDDFEPQCHAEGRRYGFVLHGLWPQYDRGYPEFCPTAERPFVPRSVIDGMLDIMPNPRLVIYQYRKHGTCSGLNPAAYFDLTRRLYGKINIPARYREPTQPLLVSPGELVQDFLAANPDLKPGMLAIECRRSGNRLREVRICFSREGEFRPCSGNEDPRRLCRTDRLYVPPVRPPARGGGGDHRLPRGSSGQQSL